MRSSVVYRNLNPVWNEDFGFKVRDLSDPILLKVYDKDSVTSDDFMGWGQIPLNDANMGRYVKRQCSIYAVTVRLSGCNQDTLTNNATGLLTFESRHLLMGTLN